MVGKKMASRPPTPSPDIAARMRKGTVQAGKPKAAGSSYAATITRRRQNTGVKDGTIRLGKAGKSYNVYDAASGTWKRGVVSTRKAATASGANPRQAERKATRRTASGFNPRQTERKAERRGR